MKKLIVVILALLFVSCGPNLKPDGSFGTEEFIGKFRGNSIYMVKTPGCDRLYISVNEDEEVTSIQSTGKYPKRLILIDGKEVSKEEALKLLKEE